MSVFLCLDSLHTGGTHPVCVLERGREREEDKGKEDKGKRVMKEGERGMERRNRMKTE